MSFTNRLIHETSPYLLQHAHNPVNWYPWGEEALEKARVENKPILLSIGYAACHWCHVMERESFEDESTAALMNRYFVNIKIDREERPDLDHIYMDAVQAITGSGGWPLNVFLTPETKPFYGGTYFPPVRAHQRMSWKEVLEAIHTAFTEQRSEIEAQAENLTAHLLHSGNFTTGASAAGEQEDLFTPDTLEQLAQQLMANADPEWGGFGQAPKFPQTFIIRYLLRHYHFTGQKAGLQQALLSLDKMVQGGIYDQLGGGFARYSTDKRWLAPHFEKMLYDNALLVVALSEAFQLTGRAQYARVIRQTLDFVERELLSPQGGFYSALDADSEGVEGKFYTWQQAELEALLGADAPLFSRLYGVEVQGNWEGTNILWLPQPLETVAQACGLPTETLLEKMMQWRQVLLNQRSQRVRPQLDDKVLLGWNALMNKAFVKAAAALNEPRYLQRAQQNMDYLLGAFRSADEGGWFHSLKKEQPPIPAFLDDYACLADALIHLQEMTGRQEYLQQAAVITDYVQQHFRDPATPLFFFTHKRQQDVVVRKKEVYDGATPSGNATMALNLLYLSVVLNRPQWREQAEAMTRLLGGVITRYPASFSIWAAAVQWITCGIAEIAVVGPGAAGLAAEVCSRYLPGKVLQSSETPAEEYPLLAGKPLAQDKVLIYLCKNYACRAPLKNVAELVEQLQQ